MRRSKTARAFLVLAGFATWSVGARAQVPVTFSPPSVSLSIGQHAQVAIQVGGVSLAAFQCELAFNPVSIDLLNPNEAYRATVTPFAPLGSDPACTTVRGTPTCNDPAWFLTSSGRTPIGIDAIDNANGSVRIAYGTYGAPAPPVAGGAIALIEVVGVYNGTTTVSLPKVVLAGTQEPSSSVSTAAGTLTVIVGTGIPNHPPVLAPIGPRSVYEELTLVVPISMSDPDVNVLTLSASGLPSFCTLTQSGNGSGSISCSPVTGQAGTYPVTVRVSDNGGPILTDEETFTITVQPTSCVDLDGDGYGVVGDISCRIGATTDCDDTSALVSPAASERCRNAIDDNCNGLADAADAVCPASVCMRITLGAPGTDPQVKFDKPALCPAPGALARGVHAIWGDLGAVHVQAGEIKLGAVQPIACADTADTRFFDNLKPEPGHVDFFLVRETSQASYGASHDGKPRSPDSGDCP